MHILPTTTKSSSVSEILRRYVKIHIPNLLLLICKASAIVKVVYSSDIIRSPSFRLLVLGPAAENKSSAVQIMPIFLHSEWLDSFQTSENTRCKDKLWFSFTRMCCDCVLLKSVILVHPITFILVVGHGLSWPVR